MLILNRQAVKSILCNRNEEPRRKRCVQVLNKKERAYLLYGRTFFVTKMCVYFLSNSMAYCKKWVKGFFSAFLVVFFVTGCATKPKAPKFQKRSLGQEFLKISASVQNVYLTSEELKAMIDSAKEFTLVDIRPAALYEQAHIVGAISIPFSEMTVRYRELEPADEIVLYCQTGKTIEKAADMLNGLGFRDVKVLEGGILQWKYGMVVEGSEQLI